jgi:hypothetical protein
MYLGIVVTYYLRKSHLCKLFNAELTPLHSFSRIFRYHRILVRNAKDTLQKNKHGALWARAIFLFFSTDLSGLKSIENPLCSAALVLQTKTWLLRKRKVNHQNRL